MKISLTVNNDGSTNLDLETSLQDHPSLIQHGYNQFLWIGERMTGLPMVPAVEEVNRGGSDGLPSPAPQGE